MNIFVWKRDQRDDWSKFNSPKTERRQPYKGYLAEPIEEAPETIELAVRVSRADLEVWAVPPEYPIGLR
jgi:hypothetical protein